MLENPAEPGAAVLISAPAAPELLVAVVLAHGDEPPAGFMAQL